MIPGMQAHPSHQPTWLCCLYKWRDKQKNANATRQRHSQNNVEANSFTSAAHVPLFLCEHLQCRDDAHEYCQDAYVTTYTMHS